MFAEKTFQHYKRNFLKGNSSVLVGVSVICTYRSLLLTLLCFEAGIDTGDIHRCVYYDSCSFLSSQI